MSQSKYDNIFLTQSDVYIDGVGPKTFKHFENPDELKRNLLIVDRRVQDDLYEETKNRDLHRSYAASETLRYMAEVQKGGSIVETGDLPKGKIAKEYLSGLDVLFTENAILDGGSTKSLDCLLEGNRQAEVVTNDHRMHSKLDAKGVNMGYPEFLSVDPEIVTKGTVNGSDKLQAKLGEQERDSNGTYSIPLDQASDILEMDLQLNQIVRFGAGKDAKYGLIKSDIEYNERNRPVKSSNERLELLPDNSYDMSLNLLGITPRNMEQFIGLDAFLLNPHIKGIFVNGDQGSGKTLISYVACAYQVLRNFTLNNVGNKVEQALGNNPQSSAFNQMVILKPDDVVGGRAIGYLPGDMYDKLKPHIGGLEDSHKLTEMGASFPFKQMFLHPKYANDFGPIRAKNANGFRGGGNKSLQLPEDMEAIELTYSGFLRGRSFSNAIVLVDEAQNFTPFEMKTIFSRLGEGCKIVVTGDPLEQIDSVRCTKLVNGFSSALNHYLGEPFVGLLNLEENNRGVMSEWTNGWTAPR